VEGFEAKYNFLLLFQIPSFSLKENIGGIETNIIGIRAILPWNSKKLYRFCVNEGFFGWLL